MKAKNWWMDLKIGDEVCDCSFTHQKIVKLDKEFLDRYHFLWYIYVPDWAPDLLDEALWWIQDKFPTHKVWVDSMLILDNRAVCSARHCCDPVDHNQPHPSVEENEESD